MSVTADDSADPLDRYKPQGYALTGPDHDHVKALDAAVRFTASARGPPFDTTLGEAGEWWEPAYGAACFALERAIVDAVTNGGNRA